MGKVLAHAGLSAIPDGTGMIPEDDAARLHRQVRLEEPDRAPDLAADAGRRTADYILAYRIPGPAKRLLKVLPPALAATFLARAIARHAWTFAGSGRFAQDGPWTFRIADNPLIRGERSEVPICHWHAAVFERLYRSLVAPDCICVETTCCAVSEAEACRFRISRQSAT